MLTEVRGRRTKRNQDRDGSFFELMPYGAEQPQQQCQHSSLYRVRLLPLAPMFCGLCFFRDSYENELPGRIHMFKTLAENGNPETSDKFIAHLFVVTGLVPPGRDEPLNEYRRKRGSLKCKADCPPSCSKHQSRGREQYTEAAWRLYPVASSLWKLMGYQPPLGLVLVRGVNGRTEPEIAKELDVSLINIHIRMAKALRTAVGYLPRGTERPADNGSSN